MTMLRPGKKPRKIAEAIMKKKNVKIAPSKSMSKKDLTGPYLQH